ncbi:hypothetical protein [Janthinobacterium sp. BJB426]|uniref:hypothetical protein n=1 Tax=Janthinobacterium sp. BJB426 TaxID=2048010 RepID=UPI0013051D9C|nr:hypothetical protein [Janthinobacterium sp. BJB426]
MTWSTTQPESGTSAVLGEEGGQQQVLIEHELPVDPGHVRTRQHYEAMLQELQGQK